VRPIPVLGPARRDGRISVGTSPRDGPERDGFPVPRSSDRDAGCRRVPTRSRFLGERSRRVASDPTGASLLGGVRGGSEGSRTPRKPWKVLGSGCNGAGWVVTESAGPRVQRALERPDRGMAAPAESGATAAGERGRTERREQTPSEGGVTTPGLSGTGRTRDRLGGPRPGDVVRSAGDSGGEAAFGPGHRWMPSRCTVRPQAKLHERDRLKHAGGLGEA